MSGEAGRFVWRPGDVLRTCEACKVPLTDEEVADYVSLCELCARSIDRLTDELLERELFDSIGGAW
jgi:hypothetical protein